MMLSTPRSAHAPALERQRSIATDSSGGDMSVCATVQ
jgi:hypothetical protein